MPIYRVEITTATTNTDIIQAAQQLGITSLEQCTLHPLYFMQGTLTQTEVEHLAQTLLADPVTDSFALSYGGPSDSMRHTVEVTLLPGVTDPAADNLRRAAHLLGITGVSQAATGQRYLLTGDLSPADLGMLASSLLANPVIQQVAIDAPITPPFVPYQAVDDTVDTIPVRDASPEMLLATSQNRRLSLNLAEMLAIQGYYRREERNPTDVELEMLAQTWSEHCVHKTFKAEIRYTGPPPGTDVNAPPELQTIPGLLNAYIRAATETVNKPWVQSAFVDNAGIIAYTDEWSLAFKVETHNHPSALEPFGGANTGVGGVVRDVLGVSARPIANTDVLCFGPPDLAEVPAGVLSPRRIAAGVISGIEDYGNKMGIPTVHGAVYYDPGYTANPLVFCGCLGLLPRDSHPTSPQPGDFIVVLGGRTGRDGLRGATFSSMEMDQDTGQVSGSAVQIGHPIQEKQVQEVILRARDEKLYHAITDCGAGGLSSAIGEMAEGLGATVQLADVPLKYPGLRPWEIWLSEAQERMVMAVSPDDWPRLQALCTGQDVEAVSLGQFDTSGYLRLYYGEAQVGSLALEFLHDGLPLGQLEAAWQPPTLPLTSAQPLDPAQTLLDLLAHPNIRSKEAIIRRYDHEVQGGTVVKPLVGVQNHGPSDAAVLLPQAVKSERGAALSVGMCPAYGQLDPYAMAWAAIDEAFRNLVAVGANPDAVALLDNFCWGNPRLPDRLGGLVRCAQGCYDAAVAYDAPFVSGKDSLNNEYTTADGQRHAIPGTLLISALGLVPDVSRTVTMDLKQVGNHLYVLGVTRAELGGSHYQMLGGDAQDRTPPQPVPDALQHFRALHQAIAGGLVAACHDCSEGGLAVTLAEMCLAGQLGATVDLSRLPAEPELSAEARLFSESLSRLVVEVAPQHADAFTAALGDVPHALIGLVSDAATLNIIGPNIDIQLAVEDLEQAWRGQTSPPAVNIASKPDAPATLTASPTVLILHANGTNRDHDAALACEIAGGTPEIVHINQLLSGERRLLDYPMLVLPGGFSYGDDLGAGTLWALDLRQRFGDAMAQFIASGRPVLGICNGFQALVKAGLLPGESLPRVTLTRNQAGHFECRWVYLQPNPNSPCLFTQGLTEPIYCPVAHGEGRLVTPDAATLTMLQTQHLDALTYITEAQGDYPANPNGSMGDIAGLCNLAGNVLGLMPHPENHSLMWQHPQRHRGHQGLSGVRLFEKGLQQC